ncbi:Pentalenene synthase [Termitomyces sp. T112]|nr:Pentalenene synthase [Termitomyces sp. T112]
MAIYLSRNVFILPDLLAKWPWKRNINPHHLQAKTESSAWIQGIIASTPPVQRAFALGNFELLASLAYPLENKDVLRAGCDLMNLFWLLDEYTDIVAPHEVQQVAMIVMDALRNPDKVRPSNECVVGEAARQFWKLSLKCASVGARRRFIDTFEKYTASLIQQAQDRVQKYVRGIDEYLDVRRQTAGVEPSVVILQFGLDLPDEVFEDPVVQRLTDTCTDMIMLSNDLYSYNVEQARGDDGHNIVTIVMHQEKIGLDEAMKWIDDYYSKLVCKFLNDLNYVPAFGEGFQSELERYLDGLGNWVRANDCWHFESHRYFAESGVDIQQSRKVVLLPRRF